MNTRETKAVNKLFKLVIFCLAMVIVCAIVTYTLKAMTGLDFSSEFGIFAGVFGGEMLLTCVIKIANTLTGTKDEKLPDLPEEHEE